MDKFLGIDFGLKRVGISITDQFKIIASPLTTVETENIFIFLEKIIKDENISTLIVGLPVNLDLSDTHSTKVTLEFIENLKLKFETLNIISFDERFTSKMASFSISQMNLKKKKREQKGLIDKISASIILQSYLSSIK